jgi:hypothetical protein
MKDTTTEPPVPPGLRELYESPSDGELEAPGGAAAGDHDRGAGRRAGRDDEPDVADRKAARNRAGAPRERLGEYPLQDLNVVGARLASQSTSLQRWILDAQRTTRPLGLTIRTRLVIDPVAMSSATLPLTTWVSS